MSRTDRAKIFLPFSPLKGFQEALEAQERVRIPQPELSEDAAEELDRTLRRLKSGDRVSVRCYRDGARHRRSGAVQRADPRRRLLMLEDETIPFGALLEIQLAEEQG